jgi:hypothetical protein
VSAVQLPSLLTENGAILTPHGMGLASQLAPSGPGAPGDLRLPRLLSATALEHGLRGAVVPETSGLAGGGAIGGVSVARVLLHLFAQEELIPAARAADGLPPRRPRRLAAAPGPGLARMLRDIGLPEGYEVQGRRVRRVHAAGRDEPGIFRVGAGRYRRGRPAGTVAAVRARWSAVLSAARTRHRGVLRDVIRGRVRLESLAGAQALHQGPTLSVWLHAEDVLSVRHAVAPWSVTSEGTTRCFRATELRVAIHLDDDGPVCQGLVTTHPPLEHMFVGASGTVCLANYTPQSRSVAQRALDLLGRAHGVLRIPRNASGIGGYQRIQSVADSALPQEVTS